MTYMMRIKVILRACQRICEKFMKKMSPLFIKHLQAKMCLLTKMGYQLLQNLIKYPNTSLIKRMDVNRMVFIRNHMKAL